MMTVAPRSSRSQILRMPFRPFIPNSGNPISRARSSTVKTSRNAMSWRRIGDIAIPAASSRPSAIERDTGYMDSRSSQWAVAIAVVAALVLSDFFGKKPGKAK